MALPPSMVAPGLDLDDTAGLPDLEIPIDVPMEFPNGAEIMDDGVGGAIVLAYQVPCHRLSRLCQCCFWQRQL